MTVTIKKLARCINFKECGSLTDGCINRRRLCKVCLAGRREARQIIKLVRTLPTDLSLLILKEARDISNKDYVYEYRNRTRLSAIKCRNYKSCKGICTDKYLMNGLYICTKCDFEYYMRNRRKVKCEKCKDKLWYRCCLKYRQ